MLDCRLLLKLRFAGIFCSNSHEPLNEFTVCSLVKRKNIMLNGKMPLVQAHTAPRVFCVVCLLASLGRRGSDWMCKLWAHRKSEITALDLLSTWLCFFFICFFFFPHPPSRFILLSRSEQQRCIWIIIPACW